MNLLEEVENFWCGLKASLIDAQDCTRLFKHPSPLTCIADAGMYYTSVMMPVALKVSWWSRVQPRASLCLAKHASDETSCSCFLLSANWHRPPLPPGQMMIDLPDCFHYIFFSPVYKITHRFVYPFYFLLPKAVADNQIPIPLTNTKKKKILSLLSSRCF